MAWHDMRGRWGLGHSVKLDLDVNIEMLQPAALYVYMQRYFAKTTVMEIESSCPYSRTYSADGVTLGETRRMPYSGFWRNFCTVRDLCRHVECLDQADPRRTYACCLQWTTSINRSRHSLV